ncbi:MAG: glycyl-radical enzyme activating protein [Deltaproteobacteria bacterium HGW-Deltaproteobacteria-12]|jgi:pyruvate formate lyase activating enzyme|nr:MAG: glycyl-radical enzyme activating protein [Deltaproteobacteria bacterium HGW-Deltaproteobacteria-12]
MREPETNKDMQGTVLQIIRMSTEDGPGIRTTVFLKGCPLHCLWCHNPESISPRPQIQWIKTSCIGCGICVKACPEKALEQTEKDISINHSTCNGCGLCTEECPTTAMELLGKKWNVHDLAGELVKDRAYFEQSGGGVTLSGGEAALQNNFCRALLQELKSRGISTALDTCGLISQAALAGLLPYVDLLLYDLKEINPEKHKKFTGAGNEKILANAIFAANYKKTHPSLKTIWIRTPVIPRATDTAENILGLGDFIAENLRGTVARWELCAFNNLCRDKYDRLGMKWPYAREELLERSLVETLAQVARTKVSPSIVCWSGSTKLEQKTSDQSVEKAANGNVTISVC